MITDVKLVSNICRYDVWVPELRIDQLRLLAGCRKRRLGTPQPPWPHLIIDDGLE